MSKIITTIVGLLFLMGSALHGYRLYSRLPVVIGGYDIPVWWSLPVGCPYQKLRSVEKSGDLFRSCVVSPACAHSSRNSTHGSAVGFAAA